MLGDAETAVKRVDSTCACAHASAWLWFEFKIVISIR